MPDLLSQNIDIVSKNLALRQYTVVLFKKDSTYYAVKYDGTLISSSTIAETVIAAAIANKGVIYFAHTGADSNLTEWVLSGSFSGFTITDNTYLVSDSKNVFITVPSGFTGVAFKFNGTTGTYPDDSTGMRGISIQGADSGRLFTAIKIEMDTTSTDSMIFTRFQDIFIYAANIGIELETTNSRWINGNVFDNIAIYDCVIGVLFDQQSGEISENTFSSVNIQCTAATTNGFKDVNSYGNVFLNCKVWDMPTTGTECNIKSTASGTQIIGGRMTGFLGHFINESTSTVILDVARTNVSNTIMRPDVQKYGAWHGSVSTAADGFLQTRLVTIAVGSGTNSSANDGTGMYLTYDTAATINSLSGQRMNATVIRRATNCYFKTAIYLNHNTNVRVFAGLVASASAPTSQADPLNALSGVALWFDSAVSANWRRYHNDSSGAGVSDDTGVAAATATLYPVEIYGQQDTKFRFVFNGTSTDITTDIPASSTSLAYWIYMENTTAASRTFRCYYTVLRTDK